MQSDADASAKDIIDDAIPKKGRVADLSELGDEFKGYAPLPTKGQDRKGFESEELSKKGLTWDAFIKTDYYSDNAEKFADLLRPSAEAQEQVAKNTIVSPDPAAAKETIAIKTESELIMQPAEPASKGQGFSIALLEPPKPPIISKFRSAAVIRTSSRKFFHRVSLPALAFVPSSDEKMAPISYLTWLKTTLDMYSGIPVNIGNDYISEDRTVKTRDDQAGFPMRSFFRDEVHASQQGILYEKFRQLQAPLNQPEPFLYARNVHYYGLPEEAALMRALQGIESRYLYEVRDWHAFHRLWDSEEIRLRAIDETILFQKRRIWVSHDYRNYRVLMDNDPAFALLISKMVSQHVAESLKINRLEDRRSLSEVFKTIQFRRDQVSFATGIADEIMRAPGPDTLKQISVLMQLARWVEAEIDISLASPTVPELVGLCMIKLLTPAYIWSPRAISLIHNALAKGLVRALPSFKANAFDADAFSFQDDMLERLCNDAALWSNQDDRRHIRDFLLSWSDRGTPGRFGLESVNKEAVPTSTSNAHGTVNFWHTDHIAASTSNRAYATRDPHTLMSFDQHRAFERFAAVVANQAQAKGRWRLIKNELIDPLHRTLTEISQRTEQVRDLMYAFNVAHRGMSLHTLTGSIFEGVIKNRIPIASFHAASFANIMFTVDPASIMNLKFDTTMYEKSLSIHHLLTDVGDGLFIAEKYLRSPNWKKTEKIQHAMTFVAPHPLKQWMETELIERKKVVPITNFFPRSYMSEKLAAAESFFRSLKPELLGYARSFIYSNGHEAEVLNVDSSTRYRTLMLAKEGLRPAHTLTLRELETLMLKAEFSQWKRDHPGPVRMKVPVALTAGEPKLTPEMPLTLSDVANISVHPIHVGFRDGDDEVRHSSDEFALLTSREYVSEIAPWVDIEPEFPLISMVSTFVVWSELELGVPLNWIQVVLKRD
jgi:hypothetical protein